MRLTVEAHPNARLERVELADTTLRVWVRTRAVDGQANAAIVRAVADALALRSSQVDIVSGARSRRKVLDVDVADIAEVRRRLSLPS